MTEEEKIIEELRAENLELRKNYFCLLEIAKEESNKISKLENKIK